METKHFITKCLDESKYAPIMKTLLINTAQEIVRKSNAVEDKERIAFKFAYAKETDPTRPLVPRSGSEFKLTSSVAVRETQEFTAERIRVEQALYKFNKTLSHACEAIANLELASERKERAKTLLAKTLTITKIFIREHEKEDNCYRYTKTERIAYTVYLLIMKH